jgi:hypothetical protein
VKKTIVTLTERKRSKVRSEEILKGKDREKWAAVFVSAKRLLSVRRRVRRMIDKKLYVSFLRPFFTPSLALHKGYQIIGKS